MDNPKMLFNSSYRVSLLKEGKTESDLRKAFIRYCGFELVTFEELVVTKSSVVFGELVIRKQSVVSE